VEAEPLTPVGSKSEARYKILMAFAEYEGRNEGGRVALQYEFAEAYRQRRINLHPTVWDGIVREIP